MTKVRIGIASFAHGHGNSYAKVLGGMQNVEFIGVHDENEERGRTVAEQFGVTFYTDYDQLLANIDGVMICTENVKHYSYGMKAAEAGVHILVEKPITTTGEEGRKLVDYCAERNVLLQTAFPVRLHTTVQEVKQQIEAGEIGEVLTIAATNHGKMPGGWFIDPELAGGGAVFDHTVHVVDIMRWLLQDEVKEVYAEIGTLLHDIPVEDCGLLSMSFHKGVIATLDTSWSRPKTFCTWGDVTLRIVGSEGVIHLDVFAQQGNLWVMEEPAAHQNIGWGDNSNAALIAEFISSIQENRQPSITGLDGLRAAEVAWAAYESVKLNRPVAVTHY